MQIKTRCNYCGREIDLDDGVIYSNNTIRCIDCAMYKIWGKYELMNKLDFLVLSGIILCMYIFVAFMIYR